jgi:DNA-binding transcriptional LysR family regulator
MELYQLRTFLTVAEEGHLTRAAEKLFSSQPAVSGQIRALEEELGLRLFERSARGMALTAAGISLREQARRIMEAAKSFHQQADGLRREVSGALVLGLNNSPDIVRLLPVLRQLTEQHPALTFDLVYGASGVILQGLDEGIISVGYFEGACTNPRIATHALTQIDLCLVAPIAWAGELAAPDWKLLEKKPWIFVSPLCSYYRTIEQICREQGLHLSARYQTNEDFTALHFVVEGLGVTMTSRAQLESYPDRHRLFVLPHFQASMPLSFGYLQARAEDPAIRAVRETVLNVWAEAGIPAPEPAEISVRLGPPAPGPNSRRTRTFKPRRNHA